MKRKFSKILGVGLTLALLASLLLTAAPVSALSVPSVTVSPTTISEADADYTIRFELDKELFGSGTATFSATPGAIVLPDVGDGATITANAGGDTATLTLTTGAVSVVLSGSGNYNTTTGVITFAAGGETAIVTATAFDTGGSWACTGTPTAGSVVDVDTDDTITITFPEGTTVAAPTATISASWGWVGGEWVASVTTGVDVASVPDDRTVTFTLGDGHKIGEGATVRIKITAGITNPDAAGDYNLTVATSQEAAETSSTYEIEVPDIGVLPGIVQQRNAADILMDQATGDDAINTMIASAGDDYTIVVGPGEYDITSTITITQAGLTLESSAGAATTIIDATDTYRINIAADDVTIDGFTIKDQANFGLRVWGVYDGVTIQNNIITSATGAVIGINIGGGATEVSVLDNEIENCTIYLDQVATDCTIADNEITEGSIVIEDDVTGLTVTGNTVTDSPDTGAIQFGGRSIDDVLIQGNTIFGNTGHGIWVTHWSGGTYVVVTNLEISENDIIDNEGDGINIEYWAATNSIKFNTITGNVDYGINTTETVDATFNWWGTDVAADIAAMIAGTGTVAYEPFLADTAEAVFSASKVAVSPATSLDASTTVGVKVSVANFDVDTIAVAKYIANPEEAIADAIAFFDVYVAGTPNADPAATIKFYVGDANTEVYLWSADTQIWAPVTPVSFSAYGGFISVTVDPDLLAGTPFALIGVAPVADVLDPPGLLAPDTGDDTVSLTPIFAWEPVTDAEGYCFELADNVNFVAPMVKLDGELGRLFVTAYAYVGELEYSTAYYWRVKATSGAFNPWIQWTQDAHFDVESDWASSVFITMDEPEEELPPVVVEEAPPVIIEPIVEVITPAATEITPSWIYVIIGVGGVLVIALLVLIVRTRRVA